MERARDLPLATAQLVAAAIADVGTEELIAVARPVAAHRLSGPWTARERFWFSGQAGITFTAAENRAIREFWTMTQVSLAAAAGVEIGERERAVAGHGLIARPCLARAAPYWLAHMPVVRAVDGRILAEKPACPCG